MNRVLCVVIIVLLVACGVLSLGLNHYRDNAITYKAQRDKKVSELKLANATITDMQIDRLEALTGYLYEIQYSADGWQTSVGLIAQDAQKALPELVTEDADVISGEKRLRLNYNGIIALLVEGFKTLRHEIKELREK